MMFLNVVMLFELSRMQIALKSNRSLKKGYQKPII